MLKNIIKYLNYGLHYAAIEHHTVAEKEHLRILLIKKNKNEFSIQSQQGHENLEQLKTVFKENQHLYLNINNNQVITKIITKELDQNKALRTAFPNIKSSDFYFEIVQFTAKTSVSICRKNYINNLLDSYKKLKIKVIGFSLANCAIQHLISFVEINKINTNNATVTINNNQIQDILPNENIEVKNYTINGLEISNNYILTLATIIAYYTNSTVSNGNCSIQNNFLKKQYLQEKHSSLGLKLGLCVLFFALLINTFIFSYYTNKINSFNQQQISNTSYFQDHLSQLEKKLNAKKNIVENINNASFSKTSYYFDQIALNLPITIILTEVHFQPLEKKAAQNKQLELLLKKITIEGNSTNDEEFSKWIQTLEKFDWTNKIEILKYSDIQNETTFKIRISIK